MVFPLAGVTGRASIMDAAGVGGLGGTYAGSPIGIAAALAVLDVIEADNLRSRALQVGDQIHARLQVLARAQPCIGRHPRPRSDAGPGVGEKPRNP